MQIKYYLLEEGSALKETILKRSLILDQENKMRNELISVIRDLENLNCLLKLPHKRYR